MGFFKIVQSCLRKSGWINAKNHKLVFGPGAHHQLTGELSLYASTSFGSDDS